MTFDMQRILENKERFRRRLAALPIAEKLKLLDVMREREIAIRAHRSAPRVPRAVRENSPDFDTDSTAAS